MKCYICNTEHAYFDMELIPLTKEEKKQEPQPKMKLICHKCLGWPEKKCTAPLYINCGVFYHNNCKGCPKYK